ncbi:hypothetical protein [Corynebacterium sp.]|uniref:hypothetical protein n=1 Tax=Corynebacterium sp. TaxID=1720 RepID=UPI002A920358|nr:hypothetical protein [Corynebacterium sp.]MDY5786135.1 hypothetical protein [Corynebacterium sp.]
MSHTLTRADRSALNACLAALDTAGFTLAEGIETDDVDDALSDDADAFRAHPVSALIGLRDPDDAPMITGRSLERLAAACCAVHGVELAEFVVVPDPGATGSGSLRLRLGAWDVADIDYDFSSADAAAQVVVVVRAIEDAAQKVRRLNA